MVGLLQFDKCHLPMLEVCPCPGAALPPKAGERLESSLPTEKTKDDAREEAGNWWFFKHLPSRQGSAVCCLPCGCALNFHDLPEVTVKRLVETDEVAPVMASVCH